MSTIVDIPVEERRFIVVTTKIRKQSRAETGADIGKVVGMAPVFLGIPGAVLTIVTGPVATGVGWLIGAIGDVNAGNIPPLKEVPAGMKLVLPSEARDLTFPAGHPLLQAAYAVHPLDHKRYLPLASFHQGLFQEKSDELLRILASLGATTVQIHAKRGFRSSTEVGASVSDGKQRAATSLNETVSSNDDCRWKETFRGTAAPALPKDLVWFHHEKAWQELARRRLDLGTMKAKTTLFYEGSHGLDAKIKAALEGMSFGVGGKFKEFESTEWDFEVDFAT